jgi:competence protein ComEC
MRTDKNIFWKLTPFLRLLFPFIGGLLTEYNFPLDIRLQVQIFCLSLLLFVFCSFISASLFARLTWVAGLAIQIIFFSFGLMFMFARKDIQIDDSPCFTKNKSNYLLARILTEPVSKQHSLKCIAEIEGLIRNQACFHENEKIFVYFKNTDTNRILTGCLIILQKQPEQIANPKNSDFDYIKYCLLRHIYAQVFLKEDEYAIIQRVQENSILSNLQTFRRHLLIIIKDALPSSNESSLLEALLIGFRDDLDPALLKSYSDAGVIHLIVISGLHLALICHILQLIPLNTGRKTVGLWIKPTLIISALWSYSLIAGGSPAIIRSALMFSITILARNISREAILYNTLAASAFLLICFDPYWIWDTGFQLSYAAVLSIRLFAKPFENLLCLQNKILAAAWKITSVSVSVQILAMPISIFYFHRVPTYFLIANLCAVPLSGAILAGGILLCSFYWFGPLAHLLAWILGFLIRFLNGFIIQVSKIPGAAITHLFISLPQLILMYCFIFCIYSFLEMRRKLWLMAGLVAISIFRISQLIS